MYTIQEVADRENVKTHTVRYWMKNGLSFEWVVNGNRPIRKIKHEELERFLEGWNRRKSKVN